jgi:tetratricopeptide (TPR) repeat protein
LSAGPASPEDIEQLRQAFVSGRLVLASGARSVAIGGSADGATINTGDVYQLTPEVYALLHPPYIPPPLPPPDFLPDPGQLPPDSHLIMAPNKVFTGRIDDLLHIAGLLLYNQASPPLVIYGFGGVGKTQLAVEFCYRYGRFMHGAHWINANTPEGIPAEVAACGLEMGLRPWPDKQPEQVAITLDSWQHQPDRLIVLDNLEEESILQEWLPKLGSVRLLITSRRGSWPKDLGLQTHSLGALSRPESLSLLHKLAPHLASLPDPDLDPLPDRLGDLPLALDLAGRYLNDQSDLIITDYLAELDRQGEAISHSSLADWTKYNPTGHATSLVQTFLVSWQPLAETATSQGQERDMVRLLAARIFFLAGYCAPNVPIPVSILEESLKIIFAPPAASRQSFLKRIFKQPPKSPPAPLVSLPDVPRHICPAINQLAELGLLTSSNPGPFLHPLLAEFARLQDSVAPESTLPSLVDAVIAQTDNANQSGYPSQFIPLRPHVQILAQTAEAVHLAQAGRLWDIMGWYLDAIADYQAAKDACQRALELDAGRLGAEHPTVATRLNNLGGVLHAQGDLAGARLHFERALPIFEKLLGPDHPNVATLVNNLGMVLQAQGDLAGARLHFERALRIDEAALGPDHPDVARDVNNLGLVQQDQGDLAGARLHFERVLPIIEKSLGVNHPYYASTLNNLGLVLYAQGDLAGARACYERALRIDEAALGPDHPKVATDVNNLGSVLKAQGDLAGARACYERALRIDEAALGPDHPNDATQVNNLGLGL